MQREPVTGGLDCGGRGIPPHAPTLAECDAETPMRHRCQAKYPVRTNMPIKLLTISRCALVSATHNDLADGGKTPCNVSPSLAAWIAGNGASRHTRQPSLNATLRRR
jgi:hypothetical protein